MNKDEQYFNAMLSEIDTVNKNYDCGNLKYIQYVDSIDNILANYGVSRKDFYQKVVDLLFNNATEIVISKPATKKKSSYAYDP